MSSIRISILQYDTGDIRPSFKKLRQKAQAELGWNPPKFGSFITHHSLLHQAISFKSPQQKNTQLTWSSRNPPFGWLETCFIPGEHLPP